MKTVYFENLTTVILKIIKEGLSYKITLFLQIFNKMKPKHYDSKLRIQGLCMQIFMCASKISCEKIWKTLLPLGPYYPALPYT